MAALFVYGMMAFGIAAAVAWGARAWKSPDRGLRCIGIVAAAVFAAGWTGFFGCALASGGGMNWLPPSFEWPVGWSSGSVRLTDGRWAVPQAYAGRVQIYDPALHFVRGWQTDARGGSFALLPRDDGGVEVLTARGELRLAYDRDGAQIGSSVCTPRQFDEAQARAATIRVPTPLWGWTFTHPMIAWFAVLLGGVTAWGCGPPRDDKQKRTAGGGPAR